tara:strand:- start:6140 stop:6760 length:621 start_codon:yes stop_codon:yes gene_type:complete
MAAKKNNMGVKDRLMKKNLTQLKAQAKRLKLKGFSTKKKNDLVKSIMMAEARNKKSKSPMRGSKSVKRISKKRGARPNLPMRTPVQMRGRRNRGMGSMVDYANFADFGYRELDLAGDLLTKYANGNMSRMAKDSFSGPYGIQVGFNKNSGNVFLMDEEYMVLMDDGTELDLFISTPYSGEEGFYDDLMEMYEDLDEEDQEYLDSFK